MAGDVFIGISTSGNSKNIVDALPICKEKGITTIALTGMKSCKMDDFDIVIKVPSAETPRIQECHINRTYYLLYCGREYFRGRI